MVSIICSIFNTRSHKHSSLERRTCRNTLPISFIWWICGTTNWNETIRCLGKVENTIGDIVISNNFSNWFPCVSSANFCSKLSSSNSDSICTSYTNWSNFHNLITHFNEIRSKVWLNTAYFYNIINCAYISRKTSCLWCRNNWRLN